MSLGLLTALSIFVGFLVDCLLGDPASLPHPVVFMGKLISFLEKRLRARLPQTPQGEETGGLILGLLVPLVSAGTGLLLLFVAWRIHRAVYFLLSTLICWQCFAARCLMVEAKKVVQCLEREDLGAARRQVGMLVGRDTGSLNEEQVLKAAVETVAENTSDGVIAPLFFMALGGAVGGLFYKAINTMDSMVGYKNQRYLHFGRFAARLDDVANFLPARLCALAMILSAPLVGLDGKNAWQIWRRDRYRHASPNSGQPESAAAGALHLQLGGNASYFGQLYEKPTLGDGDRPIAREDVGRACRLLYGASGLCLLLYGLILTLEAIL